MLRSLRRIDCRQSSHSVTGQYIAGAVGGAPVPAYSDELGASTTETVALKAHVDNGGRSLYIRTGKRLPSRQSEIFIQFRACRTLIFAGGAMVQPKLVIRLQPEENIRLLMMAKQPGSTARA